MGVFGALNTAVSGLRAQGSALENISGNIANSQTTGFKRQDSSFFEQVAGSAATQANQVAGSVTFSSRATNDIQGDLQQSDIDTHIAVQGDGYFVVQDPTGVIDGVTTFTGSDLYTRAGDFSRTNEGFLQNGAGFVLQGFNVDAQGNTGSLLEPIQIDESVTFPAISTTEVSISGNLPASPSTEFSRANADPVTGVDPADQLILPALSGAATISGADENDFIETTIAGPSFEVFNSLGASFDVPVRFAKTANADPAAGTVDTYNLYYRSASDAGPTDDAYVLVPQDFTYDADGALSPAFSSVTIPALTVDGSEIGDVDLRFAGSGLTQFENGNGTAAVSATANGSSAGSFQSVAINDGGRVTVTFTNNQTVDISQIALASFNADSGLARVDGGGTFSATVASGDPILRATGSILGGQLEASNTDIADEFTKLIITQQAYTANSRVITTGDELLSEVINIIR
ncbi:MAG: flagellar hook-basal body complex protein [Hyphomicrobiales bacterium]